MGESSLVVQPSARADNSAGQADTVDGTQLHGGIAAQLNVMLQVHNENDTYTFARMPTTVLRWIVILFAMPPVSTTTTLIGLPCSMLWDRAKNCAVSSGLRM